MRSEYETPMLRAYRPGNALEIQFGKSWIHGYPEAVSPTPLRQLREDRARLAPVAFTLAALAHRIGVSESAVWRWEQGIAVPRRRHLRALAREFGVSIEELGLTRDGHAGGSADQPHD
jgi:transcriptional regulator with XRE-family HTH domain